MIEATNRNIYRLIHNWWDERNEEVQWLPNYQTSATSILFQIYHIATFFNILRIDCSSYQMGIKFKFQFGNSVYADRHAISLAVMVFVTSVGLMWLNIRFQMSRESIFPSSRHNGTLSSILLQCSIPYDECRCSVLSNKFNSSIKCITDVEAMIGHILPLVPYALQLYLLQKLFSFTGNYSHILTDIFWLVALFVLVIIAICVHGSSCLYYYTSFIIFLTSTFWYAFFFYHLSVSRRKKFRIIIEILE